MRTEPRQRGLAAGANVVMPDFTNPVECADYQPYRGRPRLDEGGERCRPELEALAASLGDRVGWREAGISPHYRARMMRADGAGS